MTFALTFQEQLLRRAFLGVPNEWQWFVAIIIIVVREFNHWILSKLVKKMTKMENEIAMVLLSSTLSVFFGSMIAVQLVVANNIAVGSFLFVEFFLHIRVCYQIIKLNNEIESGENAVQIRNLKKAKLRNLVIDETMEVSIIIVYAIGSAFAYYGPNQDLYKKLISFEDFDAFDLFRVMFFMAIIEILGSLVCGFILKSCCSISLFKEFCDLMKKFWIIVAITLSSAFTNFFISKDVNVGSDSKREWITDEGRRKIILNSLALTNEDKNLILYNET